MLACGAGSESVSPREVEPSPDVSSTFSGGLISTKVRQGMSQYELQRSTAKKPRQQKQNAVLQPAGRKRHIRNTYILPR